MPAARQLTGAVLETSPAGTLLRIDGLAGPDDRPLAVRLPMAGRHNAANALVVAGVALALGLSADAIGRGLASFPGVGRRLERKGEAAGVAVYDDYGHHPTAIRATLEAVRQREPGRPVWALYEPRTYHRTVALLEAFADVLIEADRVVIADIWAGRDPDTTVTSAAALADAVRARRPATRAMRPIRQMTQAVNQLASAQHPTPLPEPAPVEIGTLAHSVNVLTERLRSLEAARRSVLDGSVRRWDKP